MILENDCTEAGELTRPNDAENKKPFSLSLGQLLNLPDEIVSKCKISLNMKVTDENGNWVPAIDRYQKNGEVGFGYHSHRGSSKQRNFTKIGQIVFAFAQLKDDSKKWLLISVGKITEIADHGWCPFEPLNEYNGYVGRLVIRIAEKKSAMGRYVYDLKRFIDDAEVVEVLPKEYEEIKFTGYENVHLTFGQLKLILQGLRFNDYRAALEGVKGIYCLTDKANGKIYIGSAYGDRGVAQRWDVYCDSRDGHNKKLVDLRKDKGEKYIEENFTFTILEIFSKNVSDKDIIDRENYWKEVFCCRKFGYNSN